MGTSAERLGSFEGGNLKIGIVCEGPSDYWAISCFLGEALRDLGCECIFVDLQPELDATLEEAGWGNLYWWFQKNPPHERIRRFFSGGIFDNDLDSKHCDVIVMQMDCDHIRHDSFVTKLAHDGYDVIEQIKNKSAYLVVEEILILWSQINSLTNIDIQRHVAAPAQESTDAWCLAVYRRHELIVDELPLPQLTNMFMAALEQSEGRVPLQNYTTIDKNKRRRKIYCEKHAAGFRYALNSSPSFQTLYDKVSTQLGLRHVEV